MPSGHSFPATTTMKASEKLQIELNPIAYFFKWLSFLFCLTFWGALSASGTLAGLLLGPVRSVAAQLVAVHYLVLSTRARRINGAEISSPLISALMVPYWMEKAAKNGCQKPCLFSPLVSSNKIYSVSEGSAALFYLVVEANWLNRDQTPRFWEFWMLDDVMLPFLRDASMNPSLNFLISWGRGNGLMLWAKLRSTILTFPSHPLEPGWEG